MLNKIITSLIIILNLFFFVYLISPAPDLPHLPNSVKSDEPGDTVQLKNVSAYYTNLSRTEVINFYKANYNGFFRLQLNHPPEKAREIIRDTIQSYYLEEFVLPYKESIFINGFEWENDVFTKPENRAKNRLIYQQQEYKAKIIIKQVPTNIPLRLASFYSTEAILVFIIYIYSKYLPKRKK